MRAITIQKSDQLCSLEEETAPMKTAPRLAVYARSTAPFRSNFRRQSGKPRIRAKTPFSVKHLHGNSRIRSALDEPTRTVDNRAWREGLSYNRAAQKTTCPQ